MIQLLKLISLDRCLIKKLKKCFAIIVIGNMKNDFCVLKKFQKPDHSYAPIVSADESSLLWNERLGHLNYSSIALMNKLKMVEGLPHISCLDGV